MVAAAAAGAVGRLSGMTDMAYGMTDLGVELGENDSVEVGALSAPGRLGEQPFELAVEGSWPEMVWWRVIALEDSAIVEFRAPDPAVAGLVHISTESPEPGEVGLWSSSDPAGGKRTMRLVYAPA